MRETYIGKQNFKQNFEVCLQSHHTRRKEFSSAADKNGSVEYITVVSLPSCQNLLMA